MEVNGVEVPTICQDHWNVLRGHIAALGMERYVAPNQEMVTVMMLDQVKSGLGVGNWDPLMNSWFALQINAMEALGPSYVRACGRCIVCFMNESRNPDGSCACGRSECGGRAPGSIPDFAIWLEYAARGQLEFAMEKGLMVDG